MTDSTQLFISRSLCAPRRPAWLAAAALAAAVPAAPAAAQTCGGRTGFLQTSLYHFEFRAQGWGTGVNGQVFHCVYNYPASHRVFIQWPAAYLTSLIPPGSRAAAARWTGHTPVRRNGTLFYGISLTRVPALTWARADWSPPGPAAPASAALVRRIAAWGFQAAPSPAVPEPPAPPEAAAEGSEGQVYIPVDIVFLAEFARRPLALGALIARLQSDAVRLAPFAATFTSRPTVDPAGRRAIVYQLSYQVPALARTELASLYLRLSDAALHRALFGTPDPAPLAGQDGAPTVLRATLPAPAPARLAARIASLLPRVARLDILLSDRRTVIAAMPVSYLAPSGP